MGDVSLRFRGHRSCPSNTADQLQSSVACVGFVSCIRLFDGARSRSDGSGPAPIVVVAEAEQLQKSN
jgi:hypothetical protein